MREIWIWAEVWGDRIEDVSLEIAGKASEIGRVFLILMGYGLERSAEEASRHADGVYLMEDEGFRFYDPLLFSENLARLAKEKEPDAILFGATAIGRDIAARTSAKLGTGVVSHVIDLKLEGEKIKGEVPGWGGNLSLTISSKKPFIATIKGGVFRKGEGNKRGEVKKVKPFIRTSPIRIEEVGEREREGEIEGADIVIGVGWGARKLIDKIEELSSLIKGVLGATRPVVDEGILPKERMIGQSGKTVSPKLFLSLGASGQPQYTSGFMGSEFIIAIDKNPRAPIFEVADIGIVGDLEEIIPELIKEIRGEGW